MGPSTLRLACLLAAAAMIGGCGSSSTSSTTAGAPIKTTHPPARAQAHAPARRHRARAHTPKPPGYPASVVSAFNRNCAQFVRNHTTHVPAQYRGLIPTAIGVYCSCALQDVESSVGVNRFKHDVVSIVFTHTRIPSYMVRAEQDCAGRLQETLQQATPAG
jgi:hypothetical protein